MFTIEFLQLRPTIMLNSGNCNLRCGYCYCRKEGRMPGGFMNEETLKVTIRKFIEAYPRFISFCWHGGEPLLRGVSVFRKVCEWERRYGLENQKIENRIQTNATLINEEWAQFFKEYNFKVGVSIDGPSWINDSQRIEADGTGTFARIMRGIHFLREYDVSFSVIITVTNRIVENVVEIYEFITQEGFTTVNLNPCFGDNPFAIKPVEYAVFMNSIFDLWFEEDRVELSIGYFDNILRYFLGGKPNLCHLCNSCYRHVKVDYNGDLIPCDDFLGSNFKLGNIVTQEISEIVNSRNYKRFFQLVTVPILACKECEWFSLCNGGCSRYAFNQNFQKHLNSMCTSRKLVFEHIARALDIKGA